MSDQRRSGFEVTQQRLSYLIAPRASFRLGRYCRRDRTGANNLEQRGFDRVVDPQSAKGDAARLAVVEQPSMAGVARNIMLRAGVADSQLASATAATDQTGEQGITMLGSTMMPALRNVLAYHPADRLCALPIEISVVRAGLQRQPFLARLATDLSPEPRTAVLRDGAGSTIGIGTAVYRVCHHPMDGRVARSSPGNLAVATLGRQVEPVLVEPQK